MGGDQTLLIELGDELSLELNFLSHHLALAIDELSMEGIIETVPFIASLLVHYEPDDISLPDLRREIAALFESVQELEGLQFDSRLLTFPTVYLDQWTEEARQKYRAEINPDKEDDPELIVKLNELDDLKQLERVHSGTEWWCAALGFWPGTGFLMPLDPNCNLIAPKYDPPRTFTHRGSVGLGGGISGIYPIDGPGGYQIFARTPVPVWDAEQRLPDFAKQPWLLEPRDRVRFVPCSVEEYEEIKNEVDAGTYKVSISEYDKISLRDFRP